MRADLFICFLLCSALLGLSPVEATDSRLVLDKEARDWVDRHLREMSLEQKVGQLMVPATGTHFTNLGSEKFQRIEQDIVRYHVGGYHTFRGEVLSAALLIRRMQALAAVPLLITADLEGGAGLIFRGGTRFPKAMALGATFDPSNAYRVGQVTALEAAKIGVNVNFYPVVDVNNNPRNPIINIRSFGEDPAQVSKMATAYIRGIQRNGILATAKHFPGHGDTSRDSHLELPTIEVSRDRLNKVELPPFQAAIEAGTEAIMTAHLYLPALEQEPGLPATLSRRIVTQLLRDELSFRGLIFTDAMTMRGITTHYSEAEAALRAIQAGADIILHPPDVETTFKGILEAVRQGRISQHRLNQSVRRVLEAKAKLGLHQYSLANFSDIDQDVGKLEHQLQAQKIVESAVTLVRDQGNVLPIRPESGATVLMLTLMDQPRSSDSRGQTLVREFQRRHAKTTHLKVLPATSLTEIGLIEKLAESVDYIVVGAYIRVAAYKGSISLSQNQLRLLNHLCTVQRPFVLVLFGSPYLLTFVPQLPTYILTYEDYSGAERAAVKAILGEIPFRGKLPISLPGLYPFGHGIQR